MRQTLRSGITKAIAEALDAAQVSTLRYDKRGIGASGGEYLTTGFAQQLSDDRQRLAFIRRARQLGFSLGEIGDLLGAGNGRSTGDVIRAAEAKLATISAQITELTLLQGRLRRLVRVCAHGDSVDCVALHVGETLPEASLDRVASAASEGAMA